MLQEMRAAERDPLHQGLIVERAPLRQRDVSLDLTSRVGKTQVVTNSTPLNQQVHIYPDTQIPSGNTPARALAR